MSPIGRAWLQLAVSGAIWLGGRALEAQPAALLKDIHPGTQPFGGFYASNPSHLTLLGNQVFFAAQTASDGVELWKSDGTAAGTSLVKDIAPGRMNSQPDSLAVLGNRVFFRADDGSLGPELWASDGSAAGTQPVKSIYPGSGSAPDELTAAGNALFFSADDGIHGRELWKSDGTEAGTLLVKDIAAGSDGANPSLLTAAGGEVFFFLSSVATLRVSDLWASNGTEAGTVLVHSFQPSYLPPPPVAVGASLFFSACDSSAGCGLWRADASSHAVVHLTSATPVVLFGSGGTLYFGANDGVHGNQLWKSDGTAQGTVALKDVQPVKFAVSRGAVHFIGYGGGPAGALWRTDGTSSGTLPVSGSFSDSGNVVSPLVDAQGTLFFVLSEFSGSVEITRLWKSDGSASGTGPLRVIGSQSGPPYPYASMMALGSVLLFAAGEPSGNLPPDWELWRSDGTLDGTYLVKDISTEPISSNPSFSQGSNGAVFFAADDGVHGRELWKTDGGPAGTVFVKDLNPGPRDSFPSDFAPLGPLTVFGAEDDEHGKELWVTDGSDAGTGLLKDINSTGWSSPQGFTAWNGSLIFAASDGSRGGIWSTDGTSAGTVSVAPGGPMPAPSFVVFHGALFFLALSPDRSTWGLWKTDGTAAGTQLVQSLNAYNPNRPPRYLTVSGNLLYFSAYDAASVNQLWESDGTPAGTRLVGPAGSNTDPFGLTDVNGRLFYSAHRGLWVTDGTAPGTVLLKADVRPDSLVNVAGTLFFVAQDPAHGRELWRSDGTAAGTVLVRDIRPGLSGSFPVQLTAYGRLVVFAASDDSHGMEIWRSDGTEAGTYMVQDIHPGPGSSIAATGWTIWRSRLYFAADDGVHGTEPWALALDAIGQPSACAGDAYTLCLNGGRFSVRVAFKTAGAIPTSAIRRPLTADTGAFWFFSDNNIELIVKVVDGRAVNGRYWVFAGALTDVEYTMTVVDTETGTVQTYVNPPGRLASYADTSAFEGSPAR